MITQVIGCQDDDGDERGDPANDKSEDKDADDSQHNGMIWMIADRDVNGGMLTLKARNLLPLLRKPTIFCITFQSRTECQKDYHSTG